MPDDFSSDTSTTGTIAVNEISYGVIEESGDEDWFSTNLDAGQYYDITLDGVASGGVAGLSDSYLNGVYDSTGTIFLGGDDDDSGGNLNSRSRFLANESGPHFISAGGFSSAIGAYELALTQVDFEDDFAAGTATDGAVDVGASVRGRIDVQGDTDWFAVTLEAGQDYLIELVGAEDADTQMLYEPLFQGVFDANGTYMEGTADYGGYYGVSRSVFRPQETGTYYLSAGSYVDYYYYDEGIGAYDLSIETYDLSSDLSASVETSGRLTVGGTVASDFQYLGPDDTLDYDWFAIELEAGSLYAFETREVEDGSYAFPYIEGFYDADGNAVPLEQTSLDYYGYGYGLAREVFVPTSSGTYYVAVAPDWYDDYYSYEISAEEIYAGLALPEQIQVAQGDYDTNLFGSIAAELLVGSSDENQLIGNGGRDTLLGLGGDDLLVADSGLGSDWDPQVEEGVFRLFEFLLDRAPSTAELQQGVELAYNWTWGLGDSASFILGSPEFQALWGELDNEGIIDFFYERLRGDVVDDDPGRQMWLDSLYDDDYGYGWYSRGEIASAFVLSDEYAQSATGYSIGARLQHFAEHWNDEVFSAYQAMLGRIPDQQGFENWMGRMDDGLDLSGLVQGFLGSEEYSSVNDGLSDRQFAELIFGNLGKATDAATLDDAEALLGGGLARADFAAAQVVLSEDAGLVDWMRGRGVDDLLAGGEGNDTLYAGGGTDMFVLGPSEGTDLLVGFEAWDLLDLAAFGFEDAAAAQAAFRQVGDTLVFEAEDTIVRFRQTDLSIVEPDMLVL